MAKKKSKYQAGGDTDFFNQLVDLYRQQTQGSQDYDESSDYQDMTDSPESDNSDYEDLLNKYNELESKIEALGAQTPDNIPHDYGDSFMNLIFGEDSNLPIDWSQGSQQDLEELPQKLTPAELSTYKSRGLNPNLVNTNKEVFSDYDVTNLGAWGDKRHQSRISDHNTGDAQDYGITDPKTADSLISRLQSSSEQNHIKYIIYNGKIWNPSISNEWRPYTGDNPHTNHVHVSYNRQYGGSESRYQFGGEIPNPGFDPLDETQTAEYALRHAQNLKVQRNGDFKGLIPLDTWSDDLMNYIDKFKFVNRKGEKFVKVRGSLSKYQVNNQSTNPPPETHSLQFGGIPVADTPEELYNGMNDPEYAQYGEMMLNLPHKYNMIRGLDNGQPIYVQDERGNSTTLRGNHDTKKMYGKVYEKAQMGLGAKGASASTKYKQIGGFAPNMVSTFPNTLQKDKNGVVHTAKSVLPNVNIYSTKDKMTRDFLNYLAHKTELGEGVYAEGVNIPAVNHDEEFNSEYYNNIWKSWLDNNKPLIRNLLPSAGEGSRAYYIPLVNRMKIPFYQQPTWVDNKTGYVHDRYPVDQYFEELAHAKQKKLGRDMEANFRKYPNSADYDAKAYYTPGDMEYEAHEVLAPLLQQQYRNVSLLPDSKVEEIAGNPYSSEAGINMADFERISKKRTETYKKQNEDLKKILGQKQYGGYLIMPPLYYYQ